MTGPAALLDSNVIIAAVVQEHDHYASSARLLTQCDAGLFAMAAHSIAEAYVALTRQGDRAPFRLSSDQAWGALESVRSVFALRGLTTAQTLDVVRRYAESGSIGRRLYDALIGEVAIVHQIPAIVTWNTRHMRGLFPKLAVATPAEYLSKPRG